MSLIDRMRSILALRRTSEPRTPQTERVHHPLRTQAGVLITPDTAVTVPAVWACLRYLSQTVAVLPWRVMREMKNGGEVAPTHPVDWLLHKRPSREWSSFQFRETLVHWALRWGNGYGEIERDSIGRPMALWPIHPERVTVKRDPNTGELYYEVSNGTASPSIIDVMDMFHVRGFGEGPVGVNVMAYAAEAIGWAKAVQMFGAGFFGAGANPSSIVIAKKPMTIDGMAELEKRFARLYKGPKAANKTLFLDSEMDFKQLGVEPDKAQFIATNQHLVEEVCRIFGVPPHKIQHMLRSTFSNIEHQSIEVVVDSISPWVKRFEEEADWKLFGQNRQGFYTKMNLNALLRGDSASRMQFYQGMRNIGVLTTNDILRLEDLPTVGPEGDKLVMQSQYTVLEKIGEDPPVPAALPALAPAEEDEVEEVPEEEEETEAEVEARARFLARIGELQHVHAE